MKKKNDQLTTTTGNGIVSAELQKKFDDLLALEKIMPEDLKGMSPDELKAFEKELQEKSKSLKDKELDAYIQKVEGLMGADGKNSLWETNHSLITATINNFVLDYRCLPSKSEIAALTGLSRRTVYEHLKGYSTNPFFKEKEEELSFMAQKVTNALLHHALKGDLRAAKLFLDAVDKQKTKKEPATVINTQNNYIQINRTVLSQESIEKLKPEQLKQLEQVILKNLDND